MTETGPTVFLITKEDAVRVLDRAAGCTRVGFSAATGSDIAGIRWALARAREDRADTDEDPAERRNLAGEPEHAATRARLEGLLDRAAVVIVHGLGGSATSYYARKAALAAAHAGLDSLRLNLRGADRGGVGPACGDRAPDDQGDRLQRQRHGI